MSETFYEGGRSHRHPLVPELCVGLCDSIHEHEDSVLYISMGVIIVFGVTGAEEGVIVRCVIVVS